MYLDLVQFRCICICILVFHAWHIEDQSARQPTKGKKKQSTEKNESLCWPVCISPGTSTAQRCERKPESVYLHVSAMWLTDRPSSRSASVGQHDSCPENNGTMEWTDAPPARKINMEDLLIYCKQKLGFIRYLVDFAICVCCPMAATLDNQSSFDKFTKSGEEYSTVMLAVLLDIFWKKPDAVKITTKKTSKCKTSASSTQPKAKCMKIN